MQRTGTVNYHVHKPDRQAFHIDAGGIVGRLISPELSPTSVRIADVRDASTALSFKDDAVAFAKCPTKVASFSDGADWKMTYDNELKDFFRKHLNAKEIEIFDHTVRIDDPSSDRKPARNVHSDYSPEGARRRLIDILGAERAEYWSNGHYGFVNVWRPIDDPINSAPLGFVRPNTVDHSDWLQLDLIYPDRLGHIMGLVTNPRHEWVYMSKMEPDDVVYFNIYDNHGLPSVAHSAIDLVEDDTITRIRKSIESRTLIRY